MTVKELKEMLPKDQDENNIVFISCSGTEWNINTKVKENPKITKSNDGKTDQAVIFIK